MKNSRLHRKVSQGTAFSMFWITGMIAVLIMVFVVGYIMVRGLPQITPDFFTTSPRGGLSGDGGIYSRWLPHST